MEKIDVKAPLKNGIHFVFMYFLHRFVMTYNYVKVPFAVYNPGVTSIGGRTRCSRKKRKKKGGKGIQIMWARNAR